MFAIDVAIGHTGNGKFHMVVSKALEQSADMIYWVALWRWIIPFIVICDKVISIPECIAAIRCAFSMWSSILPWVVNI